MLSWRAVPTTSKSCSPISELFFLSFSDSFFLLISSLQISLLLLLKFFLTIVQRRLFIFVYLKRKAPSGVFTSEGGFNINKTGSDLLSHTSDRAVPWVQRSLTAEFGKGSGVTTSLSHRKTVYGKKRF